MPGVAAESAAGEEAAQRADDMSEENKIPTDRCSPINNPKFSVDCQPGNHDDDDLGRELKTTQPECS